MTQKQSIAAQNDKYREQEILRAQIVAKEQERVCNNNARGECSWVLRCRDNLKQMDPTLTGLELAILTHAAAVGFNVAQVGEA